MKYQILVGFYSFIIFSTLNSYYSSSQFLAQEDYEELQHLIWHHRLRKNRLHQMFFSNLIVFVDLGCRCRLSSTSLKINAFILVLCHPFQFLSLFALQFALQFQIAFWWFRWICSLSRVARLIILFCLFELRKVALSTEHYHHIYE